jgi:hypothetical protein
VKVGPHSGALEAAERLLNGGGQASDVLREVVADVMRSGHGVPSREREGV